MKGKAHKTRNWEKFFEKVFKKCFVIWILCILLVIVFSALLYKVENIPFIKDNNVFIIIILGLVLLGCLAFAAGVFSFTIYNLRRGKSENVIKTVIKAFLLLAIFPLYVLYALFKPLASIKKVRETGIKKSFKKFRLFPFISKIIATGIILFILCPIWAGGYFMAAMVVKEQLNFVEEPIRVMGTGSMFPTFPKGEGKTPKELADEVVGTPGVMRYPNGLVIGNKRYFGYQIGRGDIVVVENDKTRELTKSRYGSPSGWVKRVVGLPGDTLELREGIVYLNGEALKEPYTARPQSTFGESFLGECKKVTVPENSIFVMGDNRKGSGDSREVGFFDLSAVNHVLPLKKQEGELTKNWRDTSKDLAESSKITLDKEKYLELLNEKRKEAGVKPLKYQSKLELSAQKRGEIILKFDDFSYEATRSGYTMEKAMRDSNYSNIVWGEAPTLGYYEAEELIENQFEFPNSEEFLLNKDYQEVGIAEVEGELNGCPAQVIVQHFAGYVPPNYKKEDIESWRNVLNRLKEIQPSWARLKENSSFYEKNRQDVDRINEIISMRISNITAIVARMDANQWFTASERKMADQDKGLYDEQEAIATRLNNL
jgi:signal peptidase I